MKVLITGACGFVGSNLVKSLLNNSDYEIVCLDDLSTGFRNNLPRKCKVIKETLGKSNKWQEKVGKVDVIFHLACIPRVSFSVDKPFESFNSSVVATISILEYARQNNCRVVFSSSSSIYGKGAALPTPEHCPASPESPYALSKWQCEEWCRMYSKLYGVDTVCLRYFNCYDKETEVLTKNGFKYFKDIIYDDEIATLNPVNYNIEYYHPIEIQSFIYNGEMIHFKNRHIDLLVTPDNNMFLSLDNGIRLFCTARDVVKNKVCGYLDQYSRWQGDESYTEEVIPSIKNDEKNPRLRKENAEKKIPIDKWVRFLGWFLSEGSVFSGESKSYGKTHKYRRITITQKNEELFDEIKKSVDDIGYSYSVVIKQHNIKELQIHNKQLYEYLKIFKNNKHIPQKILTLPVKYLEILFDSLMKGDGTGYVPTPGDSQLYTTAYKRFADNFQELLLKLGKACRVRKEYYTCKSTKRNAEYRIDIHKNNKKLIGNKHCRRKVGTYSNIVPYNDFVYDVTVPNHVIFVRRNGFACWSGNCTGPGSRFGGAYSTVLSAWMYSALVDSSVPPYIEGDGFQSRDFCDCDNVVQANILAAHHPHRLNGEAFNIGQGETHTLMDCKNILEKILNKEIKLEQKPPRIGDIRNTLADISKAKNILGYNPVVDFEKQVVKMADWYKKFYKIK